MSQTQFDAGSVGPMEALYLTPDVVAQRARVIDLLAPAPGERILDIGVGPGLLAYDLARLVGETGAMVGVDRAPAMIAAATARLSGMPQARIEDGEATELAQGDGAFDAAVCTQVYEYVSDMPAALRELHRVLRTGGRALILDTDWRSIVWHASDPELMERVLTCWDAHLFDPHLPAKLGPMLREAGFEVRRVEILPMLTPQWQPVSYAGGIIRTIHSFVQKNGDRFGLAPEDIERWRADQFELIERGAFFFSLNRYIFLAGR